MSSARLQEGRMMRRDDRTTSTIHDTDLHLRIQAEYGEMPGLRLTLSQASRLFNLERTLCERVLAALVDQRVLSQSGAIFMRPSSD
jgi:hypothetical protein